LLNGLEIRVSSVVTTWNVNI